MDVYNKISQEFLQLNFQIDLPIRYILNPFLSELYFYIIKWRLKQHLNVKFELNLKLTSNHSQTLCFPLAQKSKANSCFPVKIDQRNNSFSTSMTFESR